METTNAAVSLLKRNIYLHPDKAAYFCGERSLSFRRLDMAARRFALLLNREGITPGERVMILLPDTLAFPVAFLGCLLSGVMAVAAGADLNGEDLAYLIEDSGARMVVTNGEHAAMPSIRNAKGISLVVCDDGGLPGDAAHGDDFKNPFRPSNDTLAYMLYSSGTTGRPKGVPHRHNSLLSPCELVGKGVLGINADDVIFSTSKLSFSYGLINSLAFPLYFGATALLHPDRPDPYAIMNIIDRRSPSVFFSVPSIYARIILHSPYVGRRLPMRLCCSAGEALPASLFEEWHRFTGKEIIDGIGCTEMSYHFICNAPGQAVAGSVGRLVPGYQARLVDENDNEVPPGNEGNLLIKGDTRAPFYWNRPEKSAGSMPADGFFRTGDMLVERDNLFFYRGRRDDMFKVDALWVSPVVVEDALRSHPAVADCAVVAVTVGPFLRPGAFVVLNHEKDEASGVAEELSAHLAATLPEHMRPVRFRFVKNLPRNASGKTLRSGLKEQEMILDS